MIKMIKIMKRIKIALPKTCYMTDNKIIIVT